MQETPLTRHRFTVAKVPILRQISKHASDGVALAVLEHNKVLLVLLDG